MARHIFGEMSHHMLVRCIRNGCNSFAPRDAKHVVQHCMKMTITLTCCVHGLASSSISCVCESCQENECRQHKRPVNFTQYRKHQVACQAIRTQRKNGDFCVIKNKKTCFSWNKQGTTPSGDSVSLAFQKRRRPSSAKVRKKSTLVSSTDPRAMICAASEARCVQST